MGWIDGARTRLALLFARQRTEARYRTELRFHMDMEAERFQRAGVPRAEALRRARAIFGGETQHVESLRDGRGLAWIDGLSLDAKLAGRILRKSPGLTFVSTLGMAVAVAIGSTTYGVTSRLTGTSLPLDEGNQLVLIENVDPQGGALGARTHLHDLTVWQRSLTSVSDVGAFRHVERNLILAPDRVESIRIAEMTASAFAIARVAPLLGRGLHPNDEAPGATPVAVLGYDLWRRAFGADSTALGRRIRLASASHVVVGVMPPGFAFPINDRIWTALRPASAPRGEAAPARVIARLDAGATLAELQEEVNTIGARLAAEYPSQSALMPRARPYTQLLLHDPQLVWILHFIEFMVSLLLIVVATNVAVLVYARTARRTTEFAVRAALGASRRRIIAQLFTEGFALSGAAAVVGLGIAWFALRLVDDSARRFLGDALPFWVRFGMSPRLLLYAGTLAVVGALIVGLLPALKVTQSSAALTPSATSAGVGIGRTWTALIVVQVAVTVALLPPSIYAAFLQNGRPLDAPPSRDALAGWTAAPIHLDIDGAGDRATIESIGREYEAMNQALVRRAEAEPGVISAFLASSVPGVEPKSLVRVANDGRAEAGRVASVRELSVDPAFFAAVRVSPISGRGFRVGERATAGLVVVNAAFVRQILGGSDAVGRRITRVEEKGGSSANRADGRTMEIVGVVPDFGEPRGPSGLRPTVFQVLDDPRAARAIVIHASVPAERLGQTLRIIAMGVSPDLRIGTIRSLDETTSLGAMAERMIFATVMSVTASVVLLSAAGIYALISFTIVRRRREIGIRVALGAGRSRMLAAVLARSAGQVGLGIVLGAVAALLVLSGFEGTDRHTWVWTIPIGVAAMMAGVGLVATAGPARRALDVAPAEALRSE